MSLIDTARNALNPSGRNGLSSKDRRDAIGFAVLGLGKLAQLDWVDRLGLRRVTEQTVYQVTSAGFRTAGNAGRVFQRLGSPGRGRRVAPAQPHDVFDLTPTEDQQMLLDVVGEFADEVLRPAAAEANETCAAPEALLKASLEIGLPLLGVPEELGGIAEERSAMTGVLVHEALAKGDLGLAVAASASGGVATALALWGSDEQQQTYLSAFTGAEVPAAALGLTEPTALFDPRTPATTARRDGAGYRLHGVKSLVPRGHEAELFVIGADLDGQPRLFLVEAKSAGLSIESEPAMGVRAAALSTVILNDVKVDSIGLLGDPDAYLEAVRCARLAWCALSIGTAQAVLDYVIPYVKQRQAFGEPIAHRQSVAFMVANIAIELRAMRLVTYRAASRLAAGKDAEREIGLARRICAERGMQIGLDGVQLLGGHGFVKEHPVERWYRDLRAIAVMEGGVLV